MEDVWVVPKNIRQIGENHSHIGIYVEDYAATFISQFVKTIDTGIRQGVCVGRVYEETEKTNIVIEGIFVDPNEIDSTERLFRAEEYVKMKQDCHTLFSEKQIIGRIVIDTEVQTLTETELLQILSCESAAGEKPARFMVVAGKEEGLKQFLFSTGGIVEKLDNYFIYYDKNVEMQNYLITWHEKLRGAKVETVKPPKHEAPEEPKEEPVIRKRRTEPFPFMECAACLVLIGVCVTGIINLNNYQKMQQLEVSVRELAGNFRTEEIEEDGVEAASIDPYENEEIDLPLYIPEAERTGDADLSGQAGAENTDVSGQTGTASTDPDGQAGTESADPDGQTGTENGDPSGQTGTENGDPSGQAGTENADSSGQTGTENIDSSGQTGTENADTNSQPDEDNGSAEETMQTQTVSYQEYIVKQGDTLSSICYNFYQDRSRVSEVCELNGISDPDTIAIGQKILLP